MRVVIDTNVLVRATKNATGPAREVLRHFESEAHVLVLSQFILTELVRVLNYDRVRALHGLLPEECRQFVVSLQQVADVVDVPQGSADGSIPADPDDDPVFGTAVIGQADVLCTLDRHFLHPDVQTHCSAHRVRIVTDVELLALPRRSASPDEAGG